MASTNAQRLSNRVARLDGVTQQERIEERVNALTDTLAVLEDESERWQDMYGYVPDYVSDELQTAYASLESYAGYWGFDC
jgi:hypothetical protein